MAEQNEIPTQPTDELEDVEAHGLREVAAAAGIGAAVLGAGGAAIAASSSAHIGPAPHQTIVSHTIGQAGPVARDAGQLASDAAQLGSDAKNIATDTATQARNMTQPEVPLAQREVNTVDANYVYPTTSYAGTVERNTVVTAGHTEAAAFKTANNEERFATSTAGKETHYATTTTSRTTSSVERTTINVVKATRDAVGKGWTLQLTVLGARTSAGGNMLAPDGTVSVVDASGHTLATTSVANGTATIRFDSGTAAGSFTIHYLNSNAGFPNTSLPWLSPRV